MFANREKTEKSKLARDVGNLLIQLTFSWTKPILLKCIETWDGTKSTACPASPQITRSSSPEGGQTTIPNTRDQPVAIRYSKKNNRKCAATPTNINEDFDILRPSYNPSLLAFLLASSRRAECARCAVWIFTAETSWASCTWSRRAWRELRAWAVRKAPELLWEWKISRERGFFSFKKNTKKPTDLFFVGVFMFSPVWKGYATVCSVLQGWRHVSSLDKHTSAFLTHDSHGMIASSVIEIRGDKSFPMVNHWRVFVA